MMYVHIATKYRIYSIELKDELGENSPLTIVPGIYSIELKGT